MPDEAAAIEAVRRYLAQWEQLQPAMLEERVPGFDLALCMFRVEAVQGDRAAVVCFPPPRPGRAAAEVKERDRQLRAWGFVLVRRGNDWEVVRPFLRPDQLHADDASP